MLRDFKFLRRRNSSSEEIENVPVNPRDIPVNQTIADSNRPPLNAIPEQIRNCTAVEEQEVGIRSNKPDRTPTKPKGKASDIGVPLRTPEKPGASSKVRFGWGQKNESGSLVSESSRGGGIGTGVANLATPRSTRTVGKANSTYSECNSTQSTPTKSVSKPPNPGFGLGNVSRALANGGARVGSYAALSKGLPITCGTSTVVNTVEVPHFELKEDPSFWMEHNVQVLIRVRPLNSMERSMHGYNRCLKQESAQCITWIGQPEARFTFDHVACETVDQETLFRMVGLPMIENCLSGYNSCMFAYGQTGSGKTHTMLGEIDELEIKPSPNRGMTPRIFEFLFARIRAEEEGRRDERLKYSCKCSFLEIYNEQVADLLDPSSTNLQLREDSKNGVYVENLSEFEVHTVGDILKLLTQGSSNRKVAATNMNRESSRSHSVFTCIIESRWEKDSTSNLRFARLNLVDLAGSERQKSSGAEGERLKEAANINKSLSTLGHVIMVLLDVAHGKTRHIPYRDSRLTFLLQDSLGGNSKTMIIANVSPSICCAAETLNTLKFAQRAKLIQNNAVVNEDSSGDVIALQNQIRLLKEELLALKRQNVSRSLSFGPPPITAHMKLGHDGSCDEKATEMDQQQANSSIGSELKGNLRLSTKQLKSLESTLTGALRREQMAETSIKQLEAEIEQLNRLVRQREEDSRCTKMMLKFREDKIQRMESLVGGLIPADTYLLEENSALSEEIQLLQAKVDRNPEVTRFALENIRLLEQVRRFQDFYQEGEREMLLEEISELRNQLAHCLDGNPKQHSISKIFMPHQFDKTLQELEDCRNNLTSCLEKNAQLSREIEVLRASLHLDSSAILDDSSVEVIKESIVEVPSSDDRPPSTYHEESRQGKHETLVEHSEELMDLLLEVDILKIILKEERSARLETEERGVCLNRDLELAKEKLLLITGQYEGVKEELKEANSVIEALESQQILSINEVEDLRNSNGRYTDLLSKLELEVSNLKGQVHGQELKYLRSLKSSASENSPLQAKLKKMQNSLEKAKKLNAWYQGDRACQASNEEEMDEVRRQVEAETAEVIVCLQEELNILQQQVDDSNLKEMQTEEQLLLLQNESKELQENLCVMTQSNKELGEKLEEKKKELRTLSEELRLVTSEIEVILADGHGALDDATDQLDYISGSLCHERNWSSEHVSRIREVISEKELLIEGLKCSLEEANNKRFDLEGMLRSLRGATLVITEAHQQECSEKEEEIILLSSQLSSKTTAISDLENRIKQGCNELQKASLSATVAFVIVNRFSELNSAYIDALKSKDASLENQAAEFDRVEKEIQSLRRALAESEEICGELRLQLSMEVDRASAMEQELAKIQENDILRTSEKLITLKDGVSTLQSCVNEYTEKVRSPNRGDSEESNVLMSTDDGHERLTGSELNKQCQTKHLDVIEDMKTEVFDCSSRSDKVILACSSINQKDAGSREATLVLLKNELESALESLKGVQEEMAKLRVEKEEVWMCEQQSQESTKAILNQVISLQEAMNSFENQFGFQMVSLDQKLQTVEDTMQEFGSSWCEEHESLEFELYDAKVVAAQKSAEVSCILAKFEEAQDTMKEADIIINELMIANETLKLEIEELKTAEVTLRSEQDILVREVQNLRCSNDHNDRHIEILEKQVDSDFSEMKNLILDVEGIVSQVQFTSMGDFMSISSDILSTQSQLQETTNLMHSWIEEIWSEMLVKDCSFSVLHLCHIGILLETLTGLNAENGLLHQGLSESDTVMSELREHNLKVKGELEMCRILKGKLLADIKNGFDRISRKEDETGELTIKLTGFEKKILDLQLQEELMLQRSNHMGTELASLMKELDLSSRNMLASLHNQEIVVKMQEEVLSSQEENFVVDLCAKDFELLIMTSEFEQIALQRDNAEEVCRLSSSFIENLKSDLIFLKVDAELKDRIKEAEVALLQKEAEDTKRERQELISEINERNSTITKMSKINEVLELNIESLKVAALSNDSLKGELAELLEAKNRLVSQVRELDAEREQTLEHMKAKESALGISSACISSLEQQIEVLQNELKSKDLELRKLGFLEGENESLENELRELKEEHCSALQGLEEKKAELGTLLSRITEIGKENHRLQDNVKFLETTRSQLENDLNLSNAGLKEAKVSQSVAREELSSKSQDLKIYTDEVNSLKVENDCLKHKLQSDRQSNYENLAGLSSSMVKCSHSVESINIVNRRMSSLLEGISVLERNFEEIRENLEGTSKFVEELECLENSAQQLMTENSDLHTELSRKDDVVEGLLFDLSLLQESASKDKDLKDENDELAASLDVLEDELEARSQELDQAVTRSKLLEMQLQEKEEIISSLQLDTSKLLESTESLSCKNLELTAIIEETLEAKRSTEEELVDKRNVVETLEMELIKMDSDVVEMNNSIESLTNDLDAIACDRNEFHNEVLVLKEKLDLAEALAAENGAIATEAQQMAESRKIYAEEKEEEVRLLERSVEELECTVNVLENKVDIIKGEAERQRLEREELESELLAVKEQMHHVESSDADLKRLLDMKEKHLDEALQRMEILEREIAVKDAEIAKCKAHIAELNLHAEAQATEYKQKFKTLEAMVEQVRSEVPSTHISGTSSGKLEKNGSRPRGSGSPFKCIGLGLGHQIKSERDEELTAGRLRIEELEALAANRQKEIFMLNSRLAAAESMTHDVIRDLLGLKLDMTNYASLLDNQLVQKITEKARLKDVEAPAKDEEVTKLKQQLNEFIVERKGWLEEIDRKQAEMVAAQVALEKLRERDRLLTTENEMFKMESVNHKKQIRELENEMKKLSGQQNLHQRIHHHAKIKEENNLLKSQNEDLNLKLRRTEAILSRVREELAHYRNTNGRSPCIDFDEEERLNNLLKETEDERLQLAQKLVGLCTSILKAAGITRPACDVSVSAAEEALDQLKNRVTSLERELEDVKYKNKITNERIRLSELMPETSPLSVRQDENQQPSSNRPPHSPFLSSLDR